jgi:hypothetical protein
MSIIDDDVGIFIEGEKNKIKNKNTEQIVSLNIKVIHCKRKAKCTNEPVANNRKTMVRRTTVDSYLRKFLLAVRRKKDGDEFEPTTLRGFLSSVERYLKKHRYSESDIPGHHFARTRDTLKSIKQKELKRKGNKAQEAPSLTQQEINPTRY